MNQCAQAEPDRCPTRWNDGEAPSSSPSWLGTTVLLVEQNARSALAIADRGYVIEMGRVVLAGSADELKRDPQVQAAYLRRAAKTSRSAVILPADRHPLRV
jgi:ABC-type transporter Mla maintaining outer membrane lipid asymmetry ATPase subunit MlaF